jgi:hypothetical protein
MPRAIVALRRYPATILLAVLLFAVSLLLAATSLGTVRGGGEGDDGGSGIGGTGKSGDFGGSGFGGTGGPSPFFTSSLNTDSHADQHEEAEPEVAATQQVAETVLVEIFSVPANEPGEPSGPGLNISIDTATAAPVQHVQALRIDIAQATVLQRPAEPKQLSVPEPLPAVPSSGVNTASNTAPVNAIAEQTGVSMNRPSEQPAPMPVEPVSSETATAPETLAVVQEEEKEVREETQELASVPDRIQRPDLPPFQRIRPVERPTLLPGRPQPMRI